MKKAERMLQAIYAADEMLVHAEALLTALEELGIHGQRVERLSAAVANYDARQREAKR